MKLMRIYEELYSNIAYHGTSLQNAKSILKYGFRDGENDFKGISLTDDLDEAWDYTGYWVDEGKTPAVVEVRIRDGAEELGEDGVDKLTGELFFRKEDLTPIRIITQRS